MILLVLQKRIFTLKTFSEVRCMLNVKWNFFILGALNLLELRYTCVGGTLGTYFGFNVLLSSKLVIWSLFASG